MLIPASGADTNIAPAVRFQRLEDDYAGGDYEFEETDGNALGGKWVLHVLW